MLHKEGGMLPLTMVTFTAVSRSIEADPEVVKSLVERGINFYKLFFFRKGKFGSRRVLENIRKRLALKTVKIKAGLASAEKRKKSTPVEHVLNTIEHNSTKERKGKEIKEKKEEEQPSADPLFEIFYRSASHLSLEIIGAEYKKFREKYPEANRQSTALITSWVSRIREHEYKQDTSREKLLKAL